MCACVFGLCRTSSSCCSSRPSPPQGQRCGDVPWRGQLRRSAARVASTSAGVAPCGVEPLQHVQPLTWLTVRFSVRLTHKGRHTNRHAWWWCGRGVTRRCLAIGAHACNELRAMLQSASPRKTHGHLVACDPDLTLTHEARSPQPVMQVHDVQTPLTPSAAGTVRTRCATARGLKKDAERVRRPTTLPRP